MHEVGGILHAFGIELSKQQLQLLALAIFVGVYLMIVFERIFHRTIAALIGASVVLVVGIIPPKVAWSSIDFNTIFLLFGMMNIVTILVRSGFFNRLTKFALRITGTNPTKIMITFAVITAVLSALLDNVTTVLFITPIIVKIAIVLELNPIPFVVSVILASNMGGTATLIGDPPNIIIGSIAKKNFIDFLIHVAPHATIAFIVGQAFNVIYNRFEGNLNPKVELDLKDLEKLEFGEEDRSLMFKGLTIFVLTIVLFMIGHVIHIEPGVIALFTSSILMLWVHLSPAWILERVEWTTLIFFMGLFMVVGALEHTGVLAIASSYLVNYIGGDIDKGIWLIGGLSSIISGIVDNIPFTMSMAFVLKDMAHIIGPDIDHFWWALSLGACLGGNFTLVGASANIVAADISARHGYNIDFITFLKYGTPVAIISTITALLSYYLSYKFFGL